MRRPRSCMLRLMSLLAAGACCASGWSGAVADDRLLPQQPAQDAPTGRGLVVTSPSAPNTAAAAAAERGYRWLTTKCYLPPDFDQAIFDDLWMTWPSALRERARQATPAERRRMLFSHYGLMASRSETGPALGYVDDGRGGWVMNCLACHTGKVAGRVILGVPNSHFALQTLTEDVRTLKVQRGKALAHLDLASLKIPLGTTHGATNAVVFGVVLGALRDKDLNLRDKKSAPEFHHHDMDAPALWNVRKKRGLYADGFAAHSHRPLLQFVMLPVNKGDTLKSWEPDFKDILSWIESLKPPTYVGPVDAPLALRGQALFEKTCTRCHGTYGPQETYPARIVPIDQVGTDPVRLQALTRDYRQAMEQGWFGNYGRDKYVLDPGGYVAPPLDGIWATAPYFHNGSVPTLWHVLHPDSRPVVWKRTEDGYDQDKVGLEAEILDAVPGTAKRAFERREYFDTRLNGKSAAGHPFADELNETEKSAVLEYLKTL